MQPVGERWQEGFLEKAARVRDGKSQERCSSQNCMCKGLGEESRVYVEELGLMLRALGIHASYWTSDFQSFLLSVCS